jgi:bifunctional enzyme CysN/CysC
MTASPDSPVIYKTDDLIASDIDAYLDVHQHKSLLRFITCGSVDDGKSTLIGRLLYDSKMIFEDQLATLESDSKRMGTQGQDIDFALLVDGLAAEREQGITIDVAYRFFATEKRKFIVADCPGHEQYTRNMVTGASTADLAVILIDARKGVLVQTRRHSYLAKLLGIRNVVLAVNKMDLIDYDQAKYDAIVAEYTAFAASIGISDFTPMPISGFKGDNITEISANTPWYNGLPLMARLVVHNCPQLVRSQRQALGRLAAASSRRYNLGLFSIYSTRIGGMDLMPGLTVPRYRAVTLAGAGQLVVLQTGTESAAEPS